MKTRWVVWLSLLVIVMLWTGLGWAKQPRYGGTLRLALEGDPAFYDANQGPAPGGSAFWTGNNIYNSLLTITPPPESGTTRRAGGLMKAPRGGQRRGERA